MNEDITFNDKIPYTTTLNRALQSVYDALSNGRSGELEISFLFHILPVELKQKIKPLINEIQTRYNNAVAIMPLDLQTLDPEDMLILGKGQRLPDKKYKPKIENFYYALPVGSINQKLSPGRGGEAVDIGQVYGEINITCVMEQLGIICEAMDQAGLLIWRDRSVLKGEFYPTTDLKE